MSKTKVDSTGIDLTDNFAFTGTVTGTPGLSLADQFRLTSDFTGDANPITSNLERVDTTGQGTIGTMTNSSGTFSFPATGIYYVSFTLSIYVNSSNSRMDFRIKSTTDNSSYNASGETYVYIAYAEAPFTNSSGVPCNAR